MTPDGLCGCVGVEGPTSAHCQCPPLDGAPKCLCFNIPLAPGSASGKDPSDTLDYGTVFNHTWWYIYCLCCGYGLHGLSAGGRPMYAMVEKCILCRCTLGLKENEWPGSGKGMQGWKEGTCIETDDVCCTGFGKELCCFGQCQMPPAPKAPLIAICNQKIGGLTSEKFGK